MTVSLTTFTRQLLRDPAGISAPLPSSRSLARAMTRHLTPLDHVLELGPGTGVMTREILAAGVRPQNLHLIEMNENFCHGLKRAFPGVHVHQGTAQQVLSASGAEFTAIISGLPLRSMPLGLRIEILRAALDHLVPGGSVMQFTYGLTPPVTGRALGAVAVRQTDFILGNLPPARVFEYRRQG